MPVVAGVRGHAAHRGQLAGKELRGGGQPHRVRAYRLPGVGPGGEQADQTRVVRVPPPGRREELAARRLVEVDVIRA